MTRNGHVALVPPAGRVGDPNFVLPGGRLPFVLRFEEQEHSNRLMGADVDMDWRYCNGKMMIVGPCCLPGCMQGEVFSAVGDKDPLSLTLV